MQRKIAEELKLDHTTIKEFDMQDDFDGVDPSTRDVIQSVAALIYQTPFLGCQTIKFLGLEDCKDNKTGKGNNLQSLWVLDIRNTEWDDILTEEKLDIMDNLMELNIEAFRCWQYMNQLLQNRLPRLERLRIIKPTHKAAVPTEGTE
jgi:hypothetical protein